MKLSQCTPYKIVEFKGEPVQIIPGLARGQAQDIRVKIQHPLPYTNAKEELEKLRASTASINQLAMIKACAAEEYVMPEELREYEE